MKHTQGWEDNGNGSNESRFSALPGGYRNYNGAFGYVTGNGYWWTSTASNDGAWFRNLYYFNNVVTRDSDKKQVGFSVRCLED